MLAIAVPGRMSLLARQCWAAAAAAATAASNHRLPAALTSYRLLSCCSDSRQATRGSSRCGFRSSSSRSSSSSRCRKSSTFPQQRVCWTHLGRKLLQRTVAAIAAAGEGSSWQAMGSEERVARLREFDIILGSSSRSRRAVLSEVGLPFSVVTADIDEMAIRRERAEDLVLALAKAKAEAIIAKLKAQSPPEGESNGGTETGAGCRTKLLITADQVVVHDGTILEKPETPDEARSFICGYRRSPAGTVGAVVVTNLATGTEVSAVDATWTHFKEIPDSVIDALIAEGDVFYCSGGLMVEHPLVSPLISKMEGPIDSVMGLNKTITLDLLERAAGLV